MYFSFAHPLLVQARESEQRSINHTHQPHRYYMYAYSVVFSLLLWHLKDRDHTPAAAILMFRFITYLSRMIVPRRREHES